jgi:hypothetical protein
MVHHPLRVIVSRGADQLPDALAKDWYPAEMTGLAYRIAINYFVYDFTH